MGDGRLLGTVLCGGRSTRMGRNKCLLTLPDGTRFVDHAARRLMPLCSRVCLSGQPPFPTPLPWAEDQKSWRACGPIGGILTMLDLAVDESLDGCLVTPVDMPWLTGDDLLSIKNAWEQRPRLPTCGKCLDQDRLQPLVAIYPVGIIEPLRQLARSEHRSLQRWLQGQPHHEVMLSQRSCTNINAPEDLPS